ncbi:tetratricopeptide repeat protein [Salegentibacter sp. BDJ18]|uniref:tetratricopeptide repeat-containing sensor histidine kinase n=1 Tax=Salegentibacter sp. BDJ18 TaxID=2816376 RepID=UPI001AAE55E1|nr:tetratricopeptide repeat protein [Salegentibacter sp. BDJ18]MBO2545696.1 tetratricopeptide repeat protein [Salegentibacter sp. BDJ18]
MALLQFRNFSILILVIFPAIFFLSAGLSAQPKIDSLTTQFQQTESDSLKVVTQIQLSRQIHREAHNEEEELQYAQGAVQKALQLNDTLLYALALDNLGLLFRYHQNYDESLPLHTKAYNLVKDKDINPLNKMIFANNAGVAGRYNHNYDTAVSYYMEALKIAERENDLKNIAIASNGIGNALTSIPGRADQALDYFERSLEAEKERNNSLGVAMNYLSIGDYYIDKSNFTKAREYLNELLEINREREDQYGLAITNEFLGKSYLVEGRNLNRAKEFFTISLEGFQQMGDRQKQAEILSSLGDIEQKQGRPISAEEYYQNSLDLASGLNLHGLLMQNYLRMAHLKEETGEPAEALSYYKQGKAYEDSIKLSEQNVEIAALVRKYDLEKKENRIELLQKDRALQEARLDTQEQLLEERRILMLLMGIGLLLILIIFFLQYRNAQTKKKTNARILKEEKEKMKAIYERNLARAEILVTRLQINPHFLFNSLNAITYLIQTKENEKAMKYLVVFSRYTRMVLETSQKHIIPLSEEIKLTRYYLTLEENRFEKDFTYEIKVEESAVKGISIPPLLLQPFIENAIWHGLLPSKRDKKQLLINIIPNEKEITIIIDDNGVGRKNAGRKTTSGKKHKSMGMQIIQERISLYNKSYSGKITYEIIDKKDENCKPEGTRVVLTLQRIEGKKPDDNFNKFEALPSEAEIS